MENKKIVVASLLVGIVLGIGMVFSLVGIVRGIAFFLWITLEEIFLLTAMGVVVFAFIIPILYSTIEKRKKLAIVSILTGILIGIVDYLLLLISDFESHMPVLILSMILRIGFVWFAFILPILIYLPKLAAYASNGIKIK
ncbi:MAG: hypothetical protein ACFFAS_09175 [Promethearchaeota archaeon]